jgi:hypothetical protein
MLSLDSKCDISGIDSVNEIRKREGKSSNIIIFYMDESNCNEKKLTCSY